MGYGDFKNFPRRTASEKVLRNKALNIAKKSKYDRAHLHETRSELKPV